MNPSFVSRVRIGIFFLAFSALGIAQTPYHFEDVRVTRSLQAHWSSTYAVAFSPDGARVATANANGELGIWDAKTFQDLVPNERLVHDSYLVAVAWSKDGTRLATGDGNGVITIWNSKTYKSLRKLEGHSDVVSWLDWSPDSKTLASSSRSGAYHELGCIHRRGCPKCRA